MNTSRVYLLLCIAYFHRRIAREGAGPIGCRNSCSDRPSVGNHSGTCLEFFVSDAHLEVTARVDVEDGEAERGTVRKTSIGCTHAIRIHLSGEMSKSVYISIGFNVIESGKHFHFGCCSEVAAADNDCHYRLAGMAEIAQKETEETSGGKKAQLNAVISSDGDSE